MVWGRQVTFWKGSERLKMDLCARFIVEGEKRLCLTILSGNVLFMNDDMV